MADPCCPDFAGRRGAPFTPHWFILHDASGRIDWFATGQDGLPRSDQECADSLLAMFESSGRTLTFGKQSKKWRMWDGSGRYAPRLETFSDAMTESVARWLRDAVRDTWAAVDEILRERGNIAAERKRAADDWMPHRKFAARIWNDAGQRALMSVMARSFGVDDSLFDQVTGAIVVDNGVLRYERGGVILQPHDPADLVTRRCGPGVAWQPDARCPVFERFLAECVPDPAQRYWLLWRTANALFGRMPRKGFVNLIGETHSGKSTFTDLMADLAGDYAKNVPVETFLSKARGDQGFRQHELMGARFVHTHEPNTSDNYDVSFMKTVTGRDKQTTRTLHERPITWTPQCTPFIGSNAPIRFNTADDAMVQRQEAVLFVRGYSRMDESLPARLREELPGILALLMRVVTWEPDDLPASMVELREQMATETEPALEFVADWIGDGYLRVDHSVPSYKCAQVGPLYVQFKIWCEDAGVRPVGRKMFSEIIGRKYARHRSGGKWHFCGLVTKS